MNHNDDFWSAVDALVSDSSIEIDRPKGSHHPRYPHIVYEVDYGYLQNTSSGDGAGIDVWRGSLVDGRVCAVIVTVDLAKRDSEVKLLIGCTEEEIETVLRFHNSTSLMKGILIKR